MFVGGATGDRALSGQCGWSTRPWYPPHFDMSVRTSTSPLDEAYRSFEHRTTPAADLSDKQLVAQMRSGFDPLEETGFGGRSAVGDRAAAEAVRFSRRGLASGEGTTSPDGFLSDK